MNRYPVKQWKLVDGTELLFELVDEQFDENDWSYIGRRAICIEVMQHEVNREMRTYIMKPWFLFGEASSLFSISYGHVMASFEPSNQLIKQYYMTLYNMVGNYYSRECVDNTEIDQLYEQLAIHELSHQTAFDLDIEQQMDNYVTYDSNQTNIVSFKPKQ